MKDIDYDKTLICTKKYNSSIDAYIYSIRIETRMVSEENVPEEFIAHMLAERMRAYVNSHEFVDIEEHRLWTFDIEQAVAAMLGSELNPDGLPMGLTISNDGNMLNWCGENYVKQGTLESECNKWKAKAEEAGRAMNAAAGLWAKADAENRELRNLAHNAWSMALCAMQGMPIPADWGNSVEQGLRKYGINVDMELEGFKEDNNEND